MKQVGSGESGMIQRTQQRIHLMQKQLIRFLGLALVMLMAMVPIAEAARQNATIVVFNANWCASCRTIVPVVQDVGRQNQLPVVVIDVDYADAPKQARSYGLSIPTGELPQVYYVVPGSTSLLFDGRQYKFGMSDLIRATILQNLQEVR